jgi:ABC-type branched-subunit amino acid transport system ATPase component
MSSEPPGPASALLLRELTVERGGRAVVRDVSVEIPAGQVTALLGPNGAGKSTLVLAVGGVLKPKAGSVLLDELSLGLAPVVVSRLIPVIRTVAESGTGVLLIEQFATVALGLAEHAHVMEGGRIRFSGPASELRDNPALLRSAYLLRGSQHQPPAEPGVIAPPPAVIPDLFMPNDPWNPTPAAASTTRPANR